MDVSLNWLKEYVDLDKNVTIKEIVDKLTMSGSKVEKYTEFGKRTENVLTAQVKDIKMHKEDSKLSILSLDIGDRELIAVAKIPDIEIGDIVPVALPGAKVIGKDIKVSEVKGIKSECMVCHILDLGLDTNFPWVKPSGLLCFPKDVAIGKDINEILGLGDYIIEFEITPNRPDCLSVEGIAKELAITFGKECKELWQYKEYDFNIVDEVKNVKVTVKTDNCPRYTLNVVENVDIKPSPYDMQLKLIKSGIRPINNMVDITNFVMIEVGQPLHAFDLDKLDSNEILVRQAKSDEKLETLDGIVRELDESNMVITNGKIPVAVAGVMGGEVSGINDNTNKVVLEAANFIRASIRNTSKKLGLRTDASSRYEKGLAKDLTVHAMNRLCNLVNITKSGVVENNIIDVYNDKQIQNVVDMDYDKINSIIGTQIAKEEIDSILNKLGIRIENSKAIIPYNRTDLEIIEDLSEEVARFYGYDRLPTKLPNTELTFGEKNYEQKMQDKIKELGIASGYNEIYTYTFFSKDLLDRIKLPKDSIEYNCVKIANPLSQEFEYMRTTAIPSMLEALERNYTKKNDKVKLFEFAKVFLDADNIEKGELVREDNVITFGCYDKSVDFYDIKQDIFNILNEFKLFQNNYDIFRIEDRNEYHPGVSAKIIIGDDVIAEFGKLSPKVALNYILPDDVYIGTIYFSKLLKYANMQIKFKELPKFPAVERDIAIVIDENILTYQIEKSLKEVKYVEKVNLFDVYQGVQIEKGKKSMAYRIYLRSSDKTLEEDEINSSMEKIFNILDKKFNASIRK